MASAGLKELTLRKIGGNTAFATPDALDLKGLDEISALKASAKQAKEINQKDSEKKSTQKIINATIALRMAAEKAKSLSKETTATKIIEQIIMASDTLQKEIANVETQEAKISGQTRTATELATIADLSGGDINALIAWRIDGDVDFFLPNYKKIICDNDVSDETPPKRSMRDFDLPAADIQLITGDPKIISINGTRYQLGNNPQPPTLSQSADINLQGVPGAPTLDLTFLKIGGNSEFATPNAKTLKSNGIEGEKSALEFSAKKSKEINKISQGMKKLKSFSSNGQPQEAVNLAEIVELSGGDINALITWRIDGDIDFFLPENRMIIAENGVTANTPPNRSMRDFELPAADLQLIAGEPKIISINGTRYILGNNP